MSETKRLIQASKWNEYHSWPPLGGLRHLIHHKDTNGFNKVVKKVGKCVLIDEEAFFKWVDDNQKNKELEND